MKANQMQYQEAAEIYEKSKQPVTDVLDYAKRIGVDEWSICPECEAETPDCDDNSCLVCGITKQQ